MSFLQIILIALAASSAVMLALWLIQVRTKNAGIVDMAWPFLTALTVVWMVGTSQGDLGVRQVLIIMLSSIWGLRLGSYLLKRVLNEAEDGRYRYLREYCGKYAQPAYFVFFQLQALFVLIFALPIWAASLNTATSLSLLDGFGVLIWLLALAGEWISDNQLARFKQGVNDSSRVCKQGMWRYSRHPNYFFEWLHWWAYVFIGYGSELWWLCLCGPVVMYLFIIYFTGVPYTEQQSLRSKGDAYRDYQLTTPMFFPFLPVTGSSDNRSRLGGT